MVHSSNMETRLPCFGFLVCVILMSVTVSSENVPNEMNILMRDAKPLVSDAYLCTAYPLDFDEAYIYKFEAMAKASTAHHMLLYGCDGPEIPHSKDIWNCPRMCRGGKQTIMFAWAKNAPPTVLPKDVGLRIGKQSRIKTIVIQIHYAKAFSRSSEPDHSGLKLFLTTQRPHYSAGILLMMSANFRIPADRSEYTVDMSCEYSKSNTIYPFAYRTHAHGLGKVITGYLYNDSYHMIGKGNPQWPQAFYPAKDIIAVKTGDYLAARCTFDSSNRHRVTDVGATGDDEMCNFYIMYYTDSSVVDLPYECYNNPYPWLTGDHFPDDVSVPLPHNATLEEEAAGHHHHGSHPQAAPNPTEETTTTTTTTTTTQRNTESVKDIHIEKKLVYQPSWPAEMLNIGQVGGVSTDQSGNVYIFHRASRIWDWRSFDLYHNYKYQDAPIDSDVVVVLDKDGKFIRKFGKGQFFMPHGITVDSEDNIWLTDVALHQVFKINKGESKINMTLGQRFKHSSDLNYFCKPADVAILSTGEFFVADGYCNARIVKFSKDGKVLKAWGKHNVNMNSNPGPNVFEIVHNLAVSEKDNLLCAADRENGRIQCFDLDGNFKHIIKHREFGSKLFALDYSISHGGVLYAVNGPSSDGPSNTAVQGFTMDMSNGALIDSWNLPQGLKQPHDMCVDSVSDSVYVGELDPRQVWKLTRMSDEEAKAVFTNFGHHDDDDDDDGHHDDHHTDTHVISDVKKEHKSASVTAETADRTSSTVDHTNSSTLALQKKMTAAETGLSASMIMGLVLTVPVILLLIVVLVVRSYRAGNLKFLDKRGKGSKRILNMQNIFGNSHKGFDPLSTEESDHDLDPDDSDKEEYTASRKSRT